MKKISRQTNFTPNANLTRHKRGVGVQKLQNIRESKAQRETRTDTGKTEHYSTCLLILVSALLFVGCAGVAVIELLK